MAESTFMSTSKSEDRKSCRTLGVDMKEDKICWLMKTMLPSCNSDWFLGCFEVPPEKGESKEILSCSNR